MNWLYIALRSIILLAATWLATGCSDNDDDGPLLTMVNNEEPAPIPLQTLKETLDTEAGSLQGSLKAEGRVVHFQGIPYAAPPVGDARWQAPQAAEAWIDTLDASAPGPACLQGDSSDESEQSEDCLFLNVAAPVEEPSAARSVMVWFHGGGDDNGSGHQSIYDLVGLADATIDVLDDNAPQLGVPHSAELFYLWNLPVLQAGSDPTATVTAMQQYWGSFASEGEPVSTDNPAWPLYSDNGGEYLEIGEAITAGSGFKIEKCDFINERQLGSG